MVKKLAISLSAAALIGLSGTASALPVASNGANDSLGTAQNINGFFDLSANAQIANSTLIPHAEISGNGDDTFDFYFFSVGANDQGAVFDIDCGSQTLGFPSTGCSDRDDFFDSILTLFTAGGTEIGFDDDDFTGDPGSDGDFGFFDSLLTTTLSTGDYVVRVASFGGGEILDGEDYILNVSIGNIPTRPVPAPAAVLLFGIGLLGLALTRRRRTL